MRLLELKYNFINSEGVIVRISENLQLRAPHIFQQKVNTFNTPTCQPSCSLVGSLCRQITIERY